jgi:hypothetical protein
MSPGIRLGKVVKSNSHCDYVIQVDDGMEVFDPPRPGDYGFGSFVKLCPDGQISSDDRSPSLRPPIIGIVYNSQLINPVFLNNGPRLASDPDPLFTPDLINETRMLLGVVLIGSLSGSGGDSLNSEPRHGIQGIPREIVPVNAGAYCMSDEEIYQFHLSAEGRPQIRYYSLLMRYGGGFAAHLTEQVLQEVMDLELFQAQDQRALKMLCKELTWRNTLGTLL